MRPDGDAVPAATAPTARKAPLAHTLRAVAWSFFGVRRSADHADDVQRLNPIHVVVAGVVLAAAFVLAILLLVRWVVASGVAA